MCTNDATASIHKVFHTACYSHFFCRGLFCLNHSVVDLIVPFDFNQLIGAINHLRKEIGIILTDSTRLRIIIMNREVTLV